MMIISVFNTAKLVMVSAFAFAILAIAVPVFGHGTDRLYAHTAFSETEEVEKNITNVKVMYNPVSQQINVSFKVFKQSTVAIKLMDALGNEVQSLSNGTLESGSQSLSFDTDGKIAAGFYFVRLSSGTETVIKRLSIR